MRLNRLYISLISFLLLLLVACNNNENALTQNDSDQVEEISSLYTSLPNGGGEFGNKQPTNTGDFDVDNLDELLQPQTNIAEPFQPLSTGQINEVESSVFELTNTVRNKEGLPDLLKDPILSSLARLKSRDMRAEDYFSHISPTYGSPFKMMDNYGVSYTTAGENLAHGQPTPEQVVAAWMNSEGHRANILNNEFTHIGVGYTKNGNFWTQIFIEK